MKTIQSKKLYNGHSKAELLKMAHAKGLKIKPGISKNKLSCKLAGNKKCTCK